MKAVQALESGSIDVLAYVDLPTPNPAPEQVVIKTEAIFVNMGDIYCRKGLFPDMPPFPLTLGLECSGTIAAVWDGVLFEVGQPVLYLG